MILVFLARGVESYELGAFIDVFSWNRSYGDKPIEFETAGLRENVVCADGHLCITANKILPRIDLSVYSALAIPGGFGKAGFFEDAYSSQVSELIRHFDEERKIIASICTGALAIGRSGVLKDRSGTTYKSADNKRRNELASFGVHVLDQNIVVDRNIITSNGPSTAVDVALLMLSLLTTEENSSKIRSLMGFEGR